MQKISETARAGRPNDKRRNLVAETKYWVVPIKKGKSKETIGYDVVAHSDGGVLLLRRYLKSVYQHEKVARERAEYDKNYFTAQGHHRTWTDENG